MSYEIFIGIHSTLNIWGIFLCVFSNVLWLSVKNIYIKLREFFVCSMILASEREQKHSTFKTEGILCAMKLAGTVIKNIPHSAADLFLKRV